MDTFYEQLMALIEEADAAPIEVVGALELAKYFVISAVESEDEEA